MKSFIEVQCNENKSVDIKDRIFSELVSLIDNSNSNRSIIILPLETIEFYQIYYLYSLSASFKNKISVKKFPEKGDRCYIEPLSEVFIFHSYTEDYIPEMEGTGIDPYIKRIHLSEINSNKIEKHLLNDKNRIIKTERTAPKGNVLRPSFKNLESNNFKKIFNEDDSYNFENLEKENILLINRNEKHKHHDFLDLSNFVNVDKDIISLSDFPNSFINKQQKRVLYTNKSQEFENATVFEHASNLSYLNLSNDHQTLFTNNISLIIDKDSWVERFTNQNKIVVFLHPNQINQINLIKKQKFSVILFGNDKKTSAILENSTSVFEKKLSERINNFKEFDYQFVKYVDDDFDKICNLYFELTKSIKNIDEFEREILSKIRTTLFKSNELINTEQSDKFSNVIQSLKIFSDTLEINKFDLDPSKFSTYEKIKLLFQGYLHNQDTFFLKKNNEIEEYLKINSNNTIVILPENDIYKKQLENKFPKSSFLYLKDIMNSLHRFEPSDLMLICCYVKKNYLHKIVFSQISKKIIFICNNFEHNHYKNYFSKKAWYEIVKFDSNSEDKIKNFGDDYVTIDTKEQAEDVLDDDKMRIINLDEHLDRPIFEISNSDEEKIIPMLVKFQCGGMAYFYENHEYQIIHQDRDDDYEISKTLTSNLQYDDIVILRNTGDREIYEEESKRIIEGDEYQELEKISKKWKILLNEKFNTGQGFDTDYILSKLIEVGFTKHKSTLQNWLYGNVRCPDNMNDLKLINKVCDSRLNEKELFEIFNAAHLINSTHQSVGRGFTKKILEEIEKSLNESLLIIDNERIRVDIDKNGKVILGGDNSDNPEGWVLKIDTINTTNFYVPSSHVNRLYIP